MADETVEVDEKEIQEFFDVAVSVARKAGEVVKEAFYKEKTIDTKSCGTDLVTETDQQVEALIIGALKEKFPSHSFIGEETVSSGGKCNLTNTPTWIIDPIDGTTNFVHKWDNSKELKINNWLLIVILQVTVVIGVVYNCIKDEMYTGRKGLGAFCNGVQLRCSSCTDLSSALGITELGASREPSEIEVRIRNFRRLAEEPARVHSIRMQGSAALNMCSVASGAADFYYEYGIHVWDIAAAGIIAEEAGATLVDPSGEPLDLMARRVLVTCNKTIAQEVAKYLECIDLPRD
ncbi:Inositol monophosphatase 1 [Acropora cervicornis]|uniref:Inositol-1-monophosphatase n=1 Tax=Acropora cervicornis TaxID=6130 RepID=A0AAD9Q9H8_ACRCE|nr:Inositol monophosphatase 1 [Acropora cervicornis]